MPEAQDMQIANKLLLLYFIDKMDMPLSDSQISSFALDKYMDGSTLRQALDEMVRVGYLDEASDNSTERYTVTEDGLVALEYFPERVSAETRADINRYVMDNRKRAKKDFEITANYFYDMTTNEFIVKCGIYEDKTMLMEINLSVITREQARIACENWRARVSSLYEEVLAALSAQA